MRVVLVRGVVQEDNLGPAPREDGGQVGRDPRCPGRLTSALEWPSWI